MLSRLGYPEQGSPLAALWLLDTGLLGRALPVRGLSLPAIFRGLGEEGGLAAVGSNLTQASWSCL